MQSADSSAALAERHLFVAYFRRCNYGPTISQVLRHHTHRRQTDDGGLKPSMFFRRNKNQRVLFFSSLLNIWFLLTEKKMFKSPPFDPESFYRYKPQHLYPALFSHKRTKRAKLDNMLKYNLAFSLHWRISLVSTNIISPTLFLDFIGSEFGLL